MMQNVFPPGLAGYIASQQHRGQQQSQELGMLSQIMQMRQQQSQQQQDEQVRGIMSQAKTPEEAIPLLMRAGPAGMKAAGSLTQLLEHQVKAEAAGRERAHYSPENRARYTTPGRPEVSLPEDLSGPVMPAQPGQLDQMRYAEAGASQGVRGAETMLNHLSQREQAKATMEQTGQLRRDQMVQAAALSRERSAQAERQHGETIADRQQRAREAIQGRKDMMDAARAGRAPAQQRERMVYDAQRGGTVNLETGAFTQVTAPGGAAIPAPRGVKEPDGSTPEQAAKIVMMQQGETAIDTVKGVVFNKSGGLNRATVMAVNAPGVAGMPFHTDARIAYSAIKTAVEAKLRLETGAAAPESEVTRIMKRYMPTIADDADSANFKLDGLKEFFTDSLRQTKGVRAGTGSKTEATSGAGNTTPERRAEPRGANSRRIVVDY